MRAQIQSGALGEVGWVKLYRGGVFPGGPKSWFRDYKQTGGATLDSMIHDLDWVRYVFGEPERVFCQALMRSEPVTMDHSQVTLRMKSGLIATVIAPGPSPWLPRHGGRPAEGHAPVRHERGACAWRRAPSPLA